MKFQSKISRQLNHFRIVENPNGGSGFLPLAGSGDIIGSTYSHEFAVYLDLTSHIKTSCSCIWLWRKYKPDLKSGQIQAAYCIKK